MAKDNQATTFEKNLWDAACVLWGHIPAADYRKVIIGLIFLRYISNAFEKQYAKLVADGEGFEDDPDAYEEENIFFVPENARWNKIKDATHNPEIGIVIDDAMREIEKHNPKLKNVLPKIYASPELDKRVLGEVVDLFSNIDMESESSKDLLGRTYEYCIAQFAAYEGVKGGEFYTPASIVKLSSKFCARFQIAAFMIPVAEVAECLYKVRNLLRLTAANAATFLFLVKNQTPILGKWRK